MVWEGSEGWPEDSEVPGSRLQIGPALVIKAILAMNQFVEEISLSL